MKHQSVEYTIFCNGVEVGKRMAVSEKQAINNYRYSELGTLRMWEEGDSKGYSAVPTVVLKFQKMKEAMDNLHNQPSEYSQARLPL
jgi:hypothetical protein